MNYEYKTFLNSILMENCIKSTFIFSSFFMLFKPKTTTTL
jgi:hypothetical protein